MFHSEIRVRKPGRRLNAILKLYSLLIITAVALFSEAQIVPEKFEYDPKLLVEAPRLKSGTNELPNKIKTETLNKLANPTESKKQKSNSKILKGPDLTSGGNEFEARLHSMQNILENLFRNIPNGQIYNDLLTKMNFKIEHTKSEINKETAHPSVDLLNGGGQTTFSGSDFVHINTEQWFINNGEIKNTDIINFLLQSISAHLSADQTQFNSNLLKLRTDLKTQIPVMSFLNYTGHGDLTATETGCRDQAKIFFDALNGKAYMHFTSSSPCQLSESQEPYEQLPASFFDFGNQAYACKESIEGEEISCSLQFSNDFRCTQNIRSKIPNELQPGLRIKSNGEIIAQYFICRLQYNRPSLKLPFSKTYKFTEKARVLSE